MLNYLSSRPFAAGKPECVGSYGDGDKKENEEEPVPVFLPPIYLAISVFSNVF